MRKLIFVASTLFIAIALLLLPLPTWAIWLRPEWVLMVLIYWTMTIPTSVGVSTAFSVGLMLDFLMGTVVGEHAFALTLIIYFVSKIHIRLRMSPFLQQGLTVFFLILFYQFTIFCIQGFVGKLPTSTWYWLSSVTSCLLWPWISVLLRDMKHFVRAESLN